MNNINFIATNALIFSAIAVILIMRWRRGKLGESQWILSYPASLKILSVVGFLFVYMGVSVLVELTPDIAAKMLVIVLSIPAAAMVFMAVVEVFATATSYDDSILCQSSPWRPAVKMPFDDVVRIENAMLWIQYAVYSREGHVIRVCKWTERAHEVLGYAQEGLEARQEIPKEAAPAKA
jgi:hypothetical protein